ncbi:hypothetical protein LINPERHAP1_LOCUS4552 [Linum perenne]
MLQVSTTSKDFVPEITTQLALARIHKSQHNAATQGSHHLPKLPFNGSSNTHLLRALLPHYSELLPNRHAQPNLDGTTHHKTQPEHNQTHNSHKSTTTKQEHNHKARAQQSTTHTNKNYEANTFDYNSHPQALYSLNQILQGSTPLTNFPTCYHFHSQLLRHPLHYRRTQNVSVDQF